ncbi:MAG: hypothetical protein FD147_2357 [Chloroflexi bacterium]|nr:MAG: hypothetical protein FD147_2357 [Chloroflexota bacterium]
MRHWVWWKPGRSNYTIDPTNHGKILIFGLSRFISFQKGEFLWQYLVVMLSFRSQL